MHRVRPGIEPVSSWILVRFVSTEPRQELLPYLILHTMFVAYNSSLSYFIILFCERMRSLICSIKDSHMNILGTPFNITIYSILIFRYNKFQ